MSFKWISGENEEGKMQQTIKGERGGKTRPKKFPRNKAEERAGETKARGGVRYRILSLL